MSAWGTQCARCVNGGCFAGRFVTQGSDSIQQLHTVSKRGDAKLFQVLVRQARENRFVYVILAEDRLILPEAQAPQPNHDVHDGGLSPTAAHDRPKKKGCPAHGYCVPTRCRAYGSSYCSVSGHAGRRIAAPIRAVHAVYSRPMIFSMRRSGTSHMTATNT